MMIPGSEGDASQHDAASDSTENDSDDQDVEVVEHVLPATAANGTAGLASVKSPSVAAVPTGQANRVLSTNHIDPINEAPHAVWYVRPPSGGQFGPATGDIMRNWIAEGRVTGDSLVWREGWNEWSGAGEAFPGLVANTVSTAESGPGFPNIVANPGANNEIAFASRYPRRKKSTTLIVLGLAVACIILFGVLIYVISTRT